MGIGYFNKELTMMAFFSMWQFNLVLYLFFVVAFFQFYKLAVKNAHRDGAATVLLQFIAGGSILILAPLFPFTFPSSPVVYFLLGVACIFYAINDRLQTTVRKNLDVSTFSILNQMTNVFLIFFGFTLFQEEFIVTKLVGAVLILVANMFIFYEKGRLSLNKYALFSILASFMFSIAISIDVGISKSFNLPFYIMITLIVPAIMIWIAERITIKEIYKEFRSQSKIYYILTGICWGLAIVFSLRSFKFGAVTTIVPLSATSVLLNVLVAHLFFDERKNQGKKILAAVMVIIGVYLTVLK